MGLFSRVRTKDAKDLSNLAKLRGLEHTVLPLAGSYSKWSTFQFTTERAKSNFDNLVREEGYALEGDSVTQKMLDAIVAGDHPAKVIDEAMTNGMRNAMTKNSSGRSCPECGLHLPKYSGSYPKKCPECGAEISNGNGD